MSDAEQAGQRFNDYHRWFAGLPEIGAAALSWDITASIRFRLFASGEAMRAEWRRLAAAGNWPMRELPEGYAGLMLQAAKGVRDLPEIWTTVRQLGGEIVCPPHIMGHELMHVLHMMTVNFIDPDRLTQPSTYRHQGGQS